MQTLGYNLRLPKGLVVYRRGPSDSIINSLSHQNVAAN